MGTGYSRTDTSNNIADGNIINASDFDGEYDAIEAAFNSSSGHTHDGTSAEGGPVTVLGPAQDFVASTSEIKPKSNNTLDIGTTSLKFKDMFLAGTANLVNVTTTGDVTLTGAANNIVFDASDNALEFADSAKATFGADADLQIFHDTSNSIIRDSGTGKLALDGSTVEVRKNDGSEVMAQFVEDGAVSLYHDNSVKLATTATGVTVTGSIAMDGLSLGDNEKVQLGAGTDLELYHDGTDSIIENNTGELFIQGNNITLRSDTSTETFIAMDKDGAVELYHDNSKKLDTDSAGINVTGQIDVSTNVNITGDLDVGDDVSLSSDAAIINLGADSEVNITHVADTGVTLNVENSTTNAVTDLLKLQVQSSGTPAVGIGTGIEFSTETAAGTLETGGVIESVTTGITPTSEEFDMVFKTMSSGATAAERLKLTGSGATIGNINLNGNTIISTNTNGNLALTPNGTGDVQLDADTVRVGDNNANATITTNGTGDLTLSTNAGTNSGVITIADGADGNIALTPNGTGEVDITKVDIDSGAIDGVTLGTNSAITQAVIDNININGATIGHTDDTDLITLADGVVTVAGEVSMTTLDLGGTNVSADAGELNLLDGDTSVGGSITVADSDGIIINDGGTMKTIPASDIKTYAASASATTDDATALAIALG